MRSEAGWYRSMRAVRIVPALFGVVACLATASQATLARAAADASELARAEKRLAARFAKSGIAYPPQAVTLIALKSEGRLELWADGGAGWRFVRSFLVQATSGRLGPKLRQGDRQVPEGIYQVSALNPRSSYHLSLRLDYPNAFDQARGDEDGRATLGGDIMIHGDRVSVGCLPVGDEGIEELFALATATGIENVSVVIAPLDLRRVDARTAAARVARAPRWLGELYAGIARALTAFPLASTADRDATAVPKLRKTAAAPKCKPYDADDCQQRCADGDVASCGRAGVLFRDGRGIRRDPAKAWALLGTACARGDAVGCSALSDLLVTDDGMLRDTARAATLARAACTSGDGHGCARLASLCTERLIYPGTPGECDRDNVDRLRQRAAAKLKSRCGGWGAYDCFTLATLYVDGDPTTARRFASGSCQSGDPGGCDQLGALLEQEGDAERARSLFRRACSAGYARACRRTALSTASAGQAFGGG